MIKTIGFCASRSNSGKTTLLLNVLAELKRRGVKTAVLKHGRHLENDTEKDSNRYAAAGAEASLFVSPQGWVLEARPEDEMSIEQAVSMLAGLTGCELVLAEGYKKARIDKIAVCRSGIALELPCDERELIAVVNDQPMELSLPQFRFEEISRLCDFILMR